MTQKAEFNAEEWSQVLEGPALAGLMVVSAQRGGTIREAISMAKAYTAAREQYAGNELLDEILSSRPEADPRKYGGPEELRERGLQRLAETVRLLEQKATPEEVEAYKRLHAGRRAARGRGSQGRRLPRDRGKAGQRRRAGGAGADRLHARHRSPFSGGLILGRQEDDSAAGADRGDAVEVRRLLGQLRHHSGIERLTGRLEEPLVLRSR